MTFTSLTTASSSMALVTPTVLDTRSAAHCLCIVLGTDPRRMTALPGWTSNVIVEVARCLSHCTRLMTRREHFPILGVYLPTGDFGFDSIANASPSVIECSAGPAEDAFLGGCGRNRKR